jgi:hypothetical protein
MGLWGSFGRDINGSFWIDFNKKQCDNILNSAYAGFPKSLALPPLRWVSSGNKRKNFKNP